MIKNTKNLVVWKLKVVAGRTDGQNYMALLKMTFWGETGVVATTAGVAPLTASLRQSEAGVQGKPSR